MEQPEEMVSDKIIKPSILKRKQTLAEGEIGEEGGEFDEASTQTHTPLFCTLHSNFQIMKKRDEIDWNNIKTPLLRPSRVKQEEQSRVLSQGRFNDFSSNPFSKMSLNMPNARGPESRFLPLNLLNQNRRIDGLAIDSHGLNMSRSPDSNNN